MSLGFLCHLDLESLRTKSLFLLIEATLADVHISVTRPATTTVCEPQAIKEDMIEAYRSFLCENQTPHKFKTVFQYYLRCNS